MSAAHAAEQPAPLPLLPLPFGFLPDAVPFALRTTVALLLALLWSFWIQLDSASSAAVCVAIVAQATPGMALNKAYWRMGGTVVGGVAGVVAVAVWGQDRSMLLMVCCLWLGGCTACATLLRDFRAYGATLCGYTVGIIAISDLDVPSRAFDSAVNRGAAILVGVVSVAVVNGLLSPPAALRGLRAALEAQARAVRALALEALEAAGRRVAPEAAPARDAAGAAPDGAPPEAAAPSPASSPTPSSPAPSYDDDVHFARLGASVLALRSQAPFVAAELPDGRRRAQGALAAISALLRMLAAARQLREAPGSRAAPVPEPAPRPAASPVPVNAPVGASGPVPAFALGSAPEPASGPAPAAASGPAPDATPTLTLAPAPDPAPGLAPELAAAWLRHAEQSLRRPEDAPPPTPPPSAPATPRATLLCDTLAELLEADALARAGTRALCEGTPPPPAPALPTHHDVPAAVINALRTIIAMGLCCVFCVYGGWSGATLLVVQQSALTALLGMQPNPTAAGMSAARALPLPLLMVGVVEFGLLPQVSGFVPFALAVGPCVFVLGLLVRHPRFAASAPTMLLYLALALSPSNPPSYDLANFLNVALELTLCAAFMVLSFVLVLPVSPPRRLMRVAEGIEADLRRRMAGRGRTDDPAAQTALLHDRLALALQWLGGGAGRARHPTLLRRLYALGELDAALLRARLALRAAEARPGAPADAWGETPGAAGTDPRASANVPEEPQGGAVPGAGMEAAARTGARTGTEPEMPAGARPGTGPAALEEARARAGAALRRPHPAALAEAARALLAAAPPAAPIRPAAAPDAAAARRSWLAPWRLRPSAPPPTHPGEPPLPALAAARLEDAARRMDARRPLLLRLGLLRA